MITVLVTPTFAITSTKPSLAHANSLQLLSRSWRVFFCCLASTCRPVTTSGSYHTKKVSHIISGESCHLVTFDESQGPNSLDPVKTWRWKSWQCHGWYKQRGSTAITHLRHLQGQSLNMSFEAVNLNGTWKSCSNHVTSLMFVNHCCPYTDGGTHTSQEESLWQFGWFSSHWKRNRIHFHSFLLSTSSWNISSLTCMSQLEWGCLRFYFLGSPLVLLRNIRRSVSFGVGIILFSKHVCFLANEATLCRF